MTRYGRQSVNTFSGCSRPIRIGLRRPKWLACLALLCTGSWTGTAFSALTVVDLQTRYGFTGDPVTISWDQDPVAQETEVEVEHVENGIVEAFMVPDSPLVWTPQRTGHYRIRARSCADECSEWATSDQEGFWLYFYIKPPSF